MSLSEQDRQTMCKLHMERSELFLQKADAYYAQCDFYTAANRYYYACFHAIHALFVVNELYTRSHEGMNVLFSLHFVKTGVFDPKYGSLVARMEQLRDKADYNVLFEVGEEDLQSMRPLIHKLIEQIKEYLNKEFPFRKG